ncbi:MAG: chromosomal replication initiator protein DnaA [Firmicutes bacterium]|nr:chromosomal replication initiator protein DnaA [Bacillota bacterium]MDY5335917.1 chromosomal replication initiator protein DnaA [Bacilli bacterium]
MNTDNLWNEFLDKIKERITPLSYDTWFKDTKLYKLDGGTATIIVPLALHKKHLEENYIDDIEETFNSITGTNFNFKFILENEINEISDNNEEVIIGTSNESMGVPHQTSASANLNSEYTFDSFIVGNSNRFAFTAARAVAEKPGKAYNPLFLYGKSGLGKTHLMHAIGNYIIQNTNKKVLYVSSEQFVNDYIAAVRNNEKNTFDKIDSFKNKYRNIDVLIIDDIQFLGSATKGQEEFFHTFNQLHDSNKQIIIASDRSVDDLKMLENRLITRFNWGLTANITPPDFGLRVDIIKRKIAHQEAAEDIPIEVIEYIANINDSDVRQLEGAITRVFAYALMMNHGVVTLDIAIEALKDKISERSVYKNDIHRIQRIVCEYFKIDIEDLKGKKRSKDINYQRQIAIYLCRIMTNESYPKMGTYFGGRDHSTIISAYQKIEKDLKTNYQLQTVIEELKKRI